MEKSPTNLNTPCPDFSCPKRLLTAEQAREDLLLDTSPLWLITPAGCLPTSMPSKLTSS